MNPDMIKRLSAWTKRPKAWCWDAARDLLPLAKLISRRFNHPLDRVLFEMMRTAIKIERRDQMYAANPALDPEDERYDAVDESLDDLLSPQSGPHLKADDYDELLTVSQG